MITITNESPLLEQGVLPKTESPYLKSNKFFCLCDLNEEIADEIIEMFKNDNMSEVNNFNVYQYDFYRDTDEFKAGLKKLFEYFIFYNQWFLDNYISILSFKEEFYEATKEQILESQKTITKTNSKWPEVKSSFCGNPNLEDKLVTGIQLDSDSDNEFITIRIESNLADSFVEDKDELDHSKDKGTKIYHHHTFIQHDIVEMVSDKRIGRFYGKVTSSSVEEGGTTTVDIWKIIDETEEWVEPAQDSIGGGS